MTSGQNHPMVLLALDPFPMKPLLVLLFFASAHLLFAQQNNNNNNNNNDNQNGNSSSFEDSESDRRFWQATLPGGDFIVALDRISSVSKHEYVLDGTLLITEVSIDTNGNALTRIYQITPMTDDSALDTPKRIVERGTELLEQAGQRTETEALAMVQKKYPQTTHAKSIEFRVENIETLDALYASIEKAWKSGRGRHFKAKE